MAIYVKSKKVSETTDFVTYEYGNSPDNLNGVFTIKKDMSEWKLLKKADVPIGGIIAKITKHYLKAREFPEEMSFQA